MTLLRRAGLCAGLLLPLCATAFDQTPKTGLWKTESIANGDATTDFDCLTDAEVAEFESGKLFGASELPEGCTETDRDESSDSMRIAYRCASAQQRGEGELRFTLATPRSGSMAMKYDGSLQMTPDAAPIPVKFDIEGTSTWVSDDCGEYAEDDDDEDGVEDEYEDGDE